MSPRATLAAVAMNRSHQQGTYQPRRSKRFLMTGPHLKLTEAVSISVETDDQAETDRLWAALTADGGEESVCGWLKDRYGVSWQVFPRRLTELTMNSNKSVSNAATMAMMKQKKIDISAIEAAVKAAV